mmetsp:Transcript_98030/g.281663  ORF Transcript_98030/g.281663 Transcript_98030/m.281663 type:complete len:229 (+) Transcript_98030:87-773(+)
MAVARHRLPPGRAGLRCAHPACGYQIHQNPLYGGFCCRKCHFRLVSGSKTKKHHGGQCERRDAPEGAPRAPAVVPDAPLIADAPGLEPAEGPAAAEGAPRARGASAGETAFGLEEESFFGPPLDAELYGAGGADAAAGLDAGASGLVGEAVCIRGFSNPDTQLFNGLRASVTRETLDGRFDLQLADGTLLCWVKREHFVLPCEASAEGSAPPGHVADLRGQPPPPPPL